MAPIGMSQDGLARKTDIHPTSIERIERGGRKPRLMTILKLADGSASNPASWSTVLGRKLR